MTTITEPLAILLVEDDETDAEWCRRAVCGSANLVSIDHASSLIHALEQLNQHDYDCVLLDLGLPDAHGLAACDAVMAHPTNVPVVVLSGTDDNQTALEALRRGAQDYLVKGPDGGGIVHALRFAVMRHRSDRELADIRERIDDIERDALRRDAAREDREVAADAALVGAVEAAFARLETALDRVSRVIAELGHSAIAAGAGE